MGVFHVFLNFANGTKSRKAYHVTHRVTHSAPFLNNNFIAAPFKQLFFNNDKFLRYDHGSS